MADKWEYAAQEYNLMTANTAEDKLDACVNALQFLLTQTKSLDKLVTKTLQDVE